MRQRAYILFLEAIGKYLSTVPASRIVRFGGILGDSWHSVVRIRRSVVYANLNKVFPGELEFHRRIARRFFRKFCISVLEFFAVNGRGVRTEDLSVLGMHHFNQALKKGKGIIAVTAHIGNFDLLACSQALPGRPLGIVSKRLHVPAVNEFWMKTRERCGIQIFEEGRPPAAIVRWLKKGNVLGLVVDQRLSEARGGIRVPFFGYEVWTSSAAAELAIRTGATLLPVMIHRKPDGGHEVIFEAEISVLDDTGVVRSSTEIMKSIHRVLETWIRTYPDEWMWIHRRFKDATGMDVKPNRQQDR